MTTKTTAANGKRQTTGIRGWWVLGQDAPRYCYSGQFVRGIQATTAKEALEKAQAQPDGHKFIAVVVYDSNNDMKVIYPPEQPTGLPF